MQSIFVAAVATAVRQKPLSYTATTVRYYSSVTSATRVNMKSIPQAGSVEPSDAKKQYEGLNVCQAMKNLANADAVCFDVDSTVIQEEGIVRILCLFFVDLNLFLQ
jgi:hypothetical protein